MGDSLNGVVPVPGDARETIIVHVRSRLGQTINYPGHATVKEANVAGMRSGVSRCLACVDCLSNPNPSMEVTKVLLRGAGRTPRIRNATDNLVTYIHLRAIHSHCPPL